MVIREERWGQGGEGGQEEEKKGYKKIMLRICRRRIREIGEA
jgi:hypothetical protein